VVESALVLYRSDRQKDRVEVGYEQLAAASELAEQQSKKFGREVCVKEKRERGGYFIISTVFYQSFSSRAPFSFFLEHLYINFSSPYG
jgi:hypothetical protein